MCKVIHIHTNTLSEQGADEAIAKLAFYGYDFCKSDSPNPLEDYCYVVDKRSPEWRGWRSILAAIEWQHHDKAVEYNILQKGIDKTTTHGVYLDPEEETSCLS